MDVLPEGCIANVVSLTSSPRDVCRLAVVCSTFKSMAESDSIWERFLPSQYKDIIARAVDFLNLTRSSSSSSFASKKQLYLWLSDYPLLIDQGTKPGSFFPDPVFAVPRLSRLQSFVQPVFRLLRNRQLIEPLAPDVGGERGVVDSADRSILRRRRERQRVRTRLAPSVLDP